MTSSSKRVSHSINKEEDAEVAVVEVAATTAREGVVKAMMMVVKDNITISIMMMDMKVAEAGAEVVVVAASAIINRKVIGFKSNPATLPSTRRLRKKVMAIPAK